MTPHYYHFLIRYFGSPTHLRLTVWARDYVAFHHYFKVPPCAPK